MLAYPHVYLFYLSQGIRILDGSYSLHILAAISPFTLLAGDLTKFIQILPSVNVPVNANNVPCTNVDIIFPRTSDARRRRTKKITKIEWFRIILIPLFEIGFTGICMYEWTGLWRRSTMCTAKKWENKSTGIFPPRWTPHMEASSNFANLSYYEFLIPKSQHFSPLLHFFLVLRACQQTTDDSRWGLSNFDST